MRKMFLWGLMPVIITAILSSCSTRHISQDEIVSLVDDFEKKAEYISRRLNELKWEYYRGDRADSLEYYQRAYRALYSDIKRLNLLKSYLPLVKDDTYKRKLELIYRKHQRGVIDYAPDIQYTLESMRERIQRSPSSISFEGNLTSRRELFEALATESDRDRRRALYSVLMFGEDYIADSLAVLSRRRNQAASRIGYNSYYDLMLTADGIDRGEFFNLLDELDRISAGPYKQALDSLSGNFGFHEMRDWDIYFAFHQNDAQVAPYYTADKQKSLLEATLGGLGVNLRNLPIYFGAAVPDRGYHDKAVLSIHVPRDIRVVTELNDGRESLEALFEQAGRALYAAQIDPQDFLLAGAPTPAFEAGVARMISALAELQGWKTKYAGMPEPIATRSTNEGRFLKLYKLRKALVDIFFEREVYSDPFADLKLVYARLFEKYMMFPLEADVRPWAVDYDYLFRSVQKQNKLIGDCIAAQTYHYLRDRYNSVLDNERTREFLVQNYYRFGARDDWQTLLERGTGGKLKADYYLSFPQD